MELGGGPWGERTRAAVWLRWEGRGREKSHCVCCAPARVGALLTLNTALLSCSLLPQSKRTTAEEEAPAEAADEQAAAAGKCGSGQRGSGHGGRQPASDLHFDALERQINDALVRLSLSEEQVAASLRRAQGGGAAGPQQAQQAQLAGVQGEWWAG